MMAAVLEMNFAVIVSACTSKASRGSLWRALQLSQNAACYHPAASKECIGGCLGDLKPGQDEEAFDPLHRVIELLKLLSAVDVQPNGSMEVWWPFTAIPQAYAITRKTNRWLPMLKDTTKTCTFAVTSSCCLSITVDGVFSRTCHEGKGKTGLQTTVMGPQNLAVGQKLCISGLLLTVKKVQDEGDGVLAVAAAEETALWGSSIKMEEQCTQDVTTGKSARLIVF